MLESTYKLRDSTVLAVDPFSDILSLANPQSVISGGFVAAGSWAIRFPKFDKLKFSALVKGSCWLVVDGEADPVLAEAGDVFLLSTQRSFVLASDLSATPIEAASVFSPNVSEIVKLGGGDDCLQIGGFVRLDPLNGRFVTNVLPTLIHVRSTSARATTLQWLLNQLVGEQAADLPGSILVSSQLAQLIFVHILRLHLEEAGGLAVGWLRALADKRLAPALRLMHSDPGRSWSLEQLAKATAMSRTTFALHFKTAA